MARTFTRGDADPGNVETVRTAEGTVFHRNRHDRWCHENHADELHAVNDPKHRGASWEFLTERCGPLTEMENSGA